MVEGLDRTTGSEALVRAAGLVMLLLVLLLFLTKLQKEVIFP